MRYLIIAALSSFAAAGQSSLHVDASNLFANVGASIVWADPNPFGVPSGVLGACSGTLIHERVFLTAGHCTRISESGIPPFIHVFVTFNLHVFDDRSTWIPVIAQSWHPSTLPCPLNTCPWPPPPLPHFSDVGLMFLATPVKFIKTAALAHPGTLETGRGDSQQQIIVGYGFPDSPPGGGAPDWSRWEGVRHYRVILPEQIFDESAAIGGPGENCFGDSGGPTFLGPLAGSGKKRRQIIATTSGFEGRTCSTTSVVTRIDNENVQAWIAQEIAKFLASH
jgi:hypothetical protein